MEKNELRIGNWIEFRSQANTDKDISGKYFEVFEIKDGRVGLLIGGKEVSGFEMDVIHPIKLSTSILSDMVGFEEEFEKYIFLELFGNDYYLAWNILEEKLLFFDQGEWNYCSAGYVDSVHKIQNLYFAFNGKELPVKGK